MNVQSPVRPPPLHDLLGVSFEFNTSITTLAWDRAFAFFGLADGSVAILRANWDGAPALKPREGGGIEISAGATPPPPPAIFPVHKGAVLAMAADRLGGVITGGADGRLQRLHDGEITTIDEKPRREIRAVAGGRGGRRAFANGRNVEILGPDARRMTMPGPVTALMYDPAGLHLAAGYDGGVSLEASSIRRNPKWEQPGPHTLLAWDADGSTFAAAGPAGEVLRRDRNADDWTSSVTGQATSLAFMSDNRMVIAGADFCTAGGDNIANVSGPVACHPRFPLLACTGRNGAILLLRPGTPGAMTIRDEGAAPVLIAFSPDGNALAFAAADGEAGTVILPDLLFRIGDAR